MKIEIDQSGRIEETHRDTILALSNNKQFSIRIHRRTKRRLQEEFRKQGKPKLFTIKVFSAGIYFLIKNHGDINNQIVIDVEYLGKNNLIKSILLNFNQSSRYKNMIKDSIIFKEIGKKSKAHILAIAVYRKQRRADKIIGYKELLNLINKKSR